MKNIIYLFIVMLALGVSSCSGLLDADNPNNLLEEGLDDARAFGPMVNGLEASVLRAYGNILAPYSVASDEMIWIGSRDAWQQLNFGNLDNPNNEFTDAAFFYVGEARWWSDEVISRGEGFKSDGTLLAGDDEQLGRAYLYGAFTYMFIADMFDDFVVSSSKLEGGSPVGAANMGSLYATAVQYLNKALALSVSSDLKTALTGMLARAEFSQSLWAKVNPVNTADPLVSNSAAAATAESALALMSGDYTYDLITSASAPATVGGLDIAGEVNQRLEMRLSDEYVVSADAKTVSGISLMDPIDNIVDPALSKNVYRFNDGGQFPTYPITSAREMYLIIAENALANGDDAKFTETINSLRALDGLTPYSGQMDATELLEHSRRVNLFLQGRRIADHYRFGSPSAYWVSTSPAMTSPGTFFPITISEIRANPNVN